MNENRPIIWGIRKEKLFLFVLEYLCFDALVRWECWESCFFCFIKKQMQKEKWKQPKNTIIWVSLAEHNQESRLSEYKTRHFHFLSFWKEWMRFTPQPMMTTSGMMYRRWIQQEVTFLGRIRGYCSNLRSQQVWESENWRERWLAQITVVFLQFIECIGFLWVDQDSVSSYGQ